MASDLSTIPGEVQLRRFVKELRLVVSLFSPLFCGLILHGFCIKFDWLGRFTVPIDRGKMLRGRPLFGSNKTYRGIIAVSLGSAAGYVLQSCFPELQPPGLRDLSTLGLTLFGLGIGGASMLSELPNSFLKRQLGISAGAPGHGPAAPILYVLDQVDFLPGAWVIAWMFVPPTGPRVLWSGAFVLIAHQALSVLGAALGMRTSAR